MAIVNWFRGVYLLPFLHVCACVVTVLANPESGWKYLGLVDFPVSIAEVGLSMRFDVPPFLFFVIIGTIWWYLVSLVILALLRKLRSGS